MASPGEATKGCSKTDWNFGSIIWRFTRGTVPKERGTAKSSIPFPRSNRREKEAHPFLPFFFRSSSSPSCYNHVTNSRLRLSRFYRPNIPTDALSFHDIDIKYGFTSMDFTSFFIFLYRILEFYYPKSNNFNFLNNNQEMFFHTGRIFLEIPIEILL